MTTKKLAVLASHPIQYQAPLFRALSDQLNLHIFYAHRATSAEQAKAGFGVNFDWDVDLLKGYPNTFLKNCAKVAGIHHFFGCDTPSIASEIEKEAPDVFLLMGWNLKSYWQALRACKRFGIPVLIRGDSQLNTPRPFAVKVLKSLFYKFFIRQFSGYLIVGRRAKEYLLSYGADPKRMFFSPHCVENERFEKDSKMTEEQKMALREKLGIKKNEKVVSFVGKFVPRKRPLDLVRALSILNRRETLVRGLFVGSGPLQQMISELAEREKVKISFTGFVNQSELPRYYGITDLLVLPSDGVETWGLAVNEAMACGVPAVVSDTVGCGPDLIEDGKTGRVYPLSDVEALADAVEQMLKISSSELVQAAIQKKMEIYSIPTAVKGVLKAIDILG